VLCDLHVHTIHSGNCTFPVLRNFCRESYSAPDAVYDKLKRQGMTLVTITDHDSIDGCESLRRHADVFVSEEVTCRMPSGTELHVGIYDITEQQHVQVQHRREDLPRLLAYLEEQSIFFSVQHAFSSLTGRREREDFEWFERAFPAFEVLNGQIPSAANGRAAWLAAQTGKAELGGSDSHTLSSVGSAFTEVPGARTKAEFLQGLRRGRAKVYGEPGGYWKLTADVFRVTACMWADDRRTLLLSPLALLIPVGTFLHHLGEWSFARKWAKEFGNPQDRRGIMSGRRPQSREVAA
jgi:predicted metal-dependent phosphoesterase TrpH